VVLVVGRRRGNLGMAAIGGGCFCVRGPTRAQLEQVED
jgi:hypothetical protein